MTTIAASTNVGIYLSAPGFTNPVVISAGVTLSGYLNGYAIYGGPGFWSITNFGQIPGSGARPGGIRLTAGGAVTNEAGAVIALPISIATGVYILGGAGTVTNLGTIDAGVWLQTGGSVSNQAGATIASVSTSGGYGVGLNAGGTVTNAGLISGLYNGIDGGHGGGTVTNQSGGTLQGQFFGVQLGFPNQPAGGGGTVTNQFGGTITGDIGIVAGGSSTTVINAGAISGTFAGTVSGHGYTFTVGSGVSLSAGGTIVNQLGGSVTGASYGVYFGNAAGTVVNAGTITGPSGAVRFAAGQTDRLVVDPGAGFNGTVNGGNTVGAVAVTTLELAAGATPGALPGLGSNFLNFGSIVFDPGASWFVGGDTAGLAGTISGFAQGDTIEVTGIAATGSSFAGGVLALTEASGAATLSIVGTFTTSDFTVTNVAGGADVSLACFREGTRLRTARGDVAVEHLRVGDQMETWLGGTCAPVIWIGRRTVDCARHPRPEQVWPVRIRAGAFGSGLPNRDLWLSPDHAVFVDDVLIPVRHLVNGSTIDQERVNVVTYHHVELPRHDVLLAEGLPAESYLDTGSRRDFSNGGASVSLHPDFSARIWEAEGCAPLIVIGPKLNAVRDLVNAHTAASRHDRRSRGQEKRRGSAPDPAKGLYP